MTQFNAKTTADEVAQALSNDIQRKAVLVTGVTIGSLGYQAVRSIAQHRPSVLILAGRSLDKLEAVKAELVKIASDINVRLLQIDLTSLKSVRSAAQKVLDWQDVPVLDVVINNAALAPAEFSRTEDGFESGFGANHLAHFELVRLLLPKILASHDKRVVNISSAAHMASDIQYDSIDFDGGKNYSSMIAYSQTKTATILFTVGLVEKYGSKGLKSFSLHPGTIYTNGAKGLLDSSPEFAVSRGMYNKDGSLSDAYPWKTEQEGAATHIVAAFDPNIVSQSGSYLVDCQIANDALAPHITKDNALHLWSFSENLIGTKY